MKIRLRHWPTSKQESGNPHQQECHPLGNSSQGVSSLGDPGARAGYCDSKQKTDSRGGRASAVDTGALGRRGAGKGKEAAHQRPAWGGGGALVPTHKPFLHFCSFALSAEIQRQEYLEWPQANNSNNNNNTPAQDFLSPRPGLTGRLSGAIWSGTRENSVPAPSNPS